jgi:hypothetical protein
MIGKRVKNLVDTRFFTPDVLPQSGSYILCSFTVFACAKTPQGAALTSGFYVPFEKVTPENIQDYVK